MRKKNNRSVTSNNGLVSLNDYKKKKQNFETKKNSMAIRIEENAD